MDALKRLLMVIGGGTILGFALWGLSTLDTMNVGGWIAISLVLAFAAWMTWGSATLRRSMAQQSKKPELTIVTRYVVPPSDLDHLKSRLRGYSITSFAAVGILLLGWSQRDSEVTNVAWLPEGVLPSFPDLGYPVSATGFLLLALGTLVASTSKAAARWLRKNEHLLLPEEAVASVVALAGLTLGWYGGLPVVLELPVGYVYVYVYGGFIFLVSLFWFVIWDWYSRPIRAAATGIARRIRRHPPT